MLPAMPRKAAFTAQELLARLVAMPTVSRDSNLELIDFVREYLDSYGVTSRLVMSPCGLKASLFATVGPPVAGGVVLSGHSDVVPVDGQQWSSDPWRLTERDGRLYGRGTSDMKAFSALALALVPEMHRLQRPIHFALSYDEEVGCQGAPALIDALTEAVPAPLAVIVGEPTSMRVVTEHKSLLIFETRVRGLEAHSSQQHLGVSAVMVAGRLIAWLAERQRACAERTPADPALEPAYTTLHCGLVQGGTAQNICARDCRFVTDIRARGHDSAHGHLQAYQRFAREILEAEMCAVHPDCGIEIEVLADVPGFQARPDCEAVRLAHRLTGHNDSDAVVFGAEAGQFQAAGHAVVMCGPGSIDQAHQPDEYISLEQLAAGERFMRRLIDELSLPAAGTARRA